MYTGKALSWHMRNRLMLTNLAYPISRLRGGMRLHYGTEITPQTKLGVMAQKAEKMLLKIINE